MFANLDFETLVGIAIVLIGGLAKLVEWLGSSSKRRARDTHVEEVFVPPPLSPPPPPPHAPPGRRPATSWEKEIEALLRGETPAAPPPLAPPPLAPTRRAAPPAPAIVEEPEPTPLAVPPSLVVFEESEIESRPAPTRPLATFAQSTAAFQRAADLHARVAAHMHRADQRTTHPVAAGPSARRAVAPEIASLLASLRHPRAARQAILASVVLGPPLALADSSAR